VFREDFLFPDIDFSALLEQNAKLLLEVSVRTPLAFGFSSDLQILGRIRVPLKAWLEHKMKQVDGVEYQGSSDVDVDLDTISALLSSAGGEDGKWFDVMLHSQAVGELKMKITCL
jgi:hypothetical protein